jgi:AraC-like DNA-binding protein
VPAAYFDLICREFGGTPEAETALRAGTDVAAHEPGSEITLGQQLRQIRNVNRLRPPGWALEIGSILDAATHGPVGFAAVSAPTLAESLEVIARFAHVRSPYFRFEARGDAHRFSLRVDERVELLDEERAPLIETLMLSVQKLVELILGHPMREAAFAFAYPPPPYANRYASYFHGGVRFDADRTVLAVPSAWLRFRCPMADPVMYEASVRKLEMLARRLDSDEHIVARIEQLIAGRRNGRLSLEEVAKRVRVSTRTLIRRLRRAGTTYHDLLDTHLRESAEALLTNPHFGIAEVSQCLGYEDAANFGRACRRWFGMAPSRYRRKLLVSADRAEATAPSDRRGRRRPRRR